MSVLLGMTKGQIEELLPRGWWVSMPAAYHGHDVWIYSTANKLRGRWHNGTAKHWKDQSDQFKAWAKGGFKGTFAPAPPYV